MLSNLKVLRIEDEHAHFVKLDPNECAIYMPCSPNECLIIENQNGYREGRCPKCGARIYAHGLITGHDRW